MLTVLRISNMVKSLDEGDGVTVEVSTHDGKCSYAHDLGKDETTDLVEALDTWGRDCSCCDTLREQVTRLTNTNAELSAAVAQMTEGVPVAWLATHICGSPEATAYEDRRDVLAKYGAKIEPLFRAANHAQAAELAAVRKELADARADIDDAAELRKQAEDRAFSLEKSLSAEKRMREETRLDLVKAQDQRDAARSTIHAMCGERDALRARIDTLMDGERLTKDALAAAEKRAAKAAEQVERSLAVAEGWKAQADTVAAQRDKMHAKAEAAAARVKVLEGDAEPVGWRGYHGGKPFGFTADKPHADSWAKDGATIEPLYRHPPKTGEPVAWRIEYGPSDYGHTDSSERVARAKSQDAKITPLYEAPPPAALGVTDERYAYACVVSGGPGGEFLRLLDGQSRRVGSRAEAQGAAHDDETASAVRLIDADAPTVDVAALRALAAKAEAGGFTIQASSLRKLVG